MDLNVDESLLKLKLILGRFIESNNSHTGTDCQLKKLLTTLAKKENISNILLNSSVVSNWFTEAITYWDSNGITPNINIANFTLTLVSVVSRSESKFCALNTNNFYIKLMRIIKPASPSIQLGHIKLLSALLDHRSGTEWMIACTYWKSVLKYSLSSQSVCVTSAGRHFMAKLLTKTVALDEDFCEKVVGKIMAPLSEINLRPIANEIDITPAEQTRYDEGVYRQLSPMLQLIGDILEQFVESEMFEQKQFRLITIIMEYFYSDQMVYNYSFLIRQNYYLTFDLCRIMFLIQFLELYNNIVVINENNCINRKDIQSTINNIAEIFNENIAKGNYRHLMQFCHFGQYYSTLLSRNIPPYCPGTIPTNKTDQDIFSVSHDLFLLQVLPPYGMCFKFGLMSYFEEDDFRCAFLEKVFKIATVNGIRQCYNFKNYLTGHADSFEIAVKGLGYIVKSMKYYSRSKGLIMFQFLFYTLQDIILIMQLNPEELDKFSKEIAYFSLLFHTTRIFIENYHITWQDCVETINVMSAAFDFLSLPLTWAVSIEVNVLKLINTSIAKYMAPNMALLVDRTTDSTMSLLGSLLSEKLQDNSWEICQITLDIVCTVSAISNTKFPSFQQVLLDSDLPNAVIKIALNGDNGAVRVAAIKCLQEMIKIKTFWKNNVLNSDNFPQIVGQILRNDPEAAARAEAATLTCVLYENQHFSLDAVAAADIHDAMTSCMTKESHWDVKVKALRFWDKIIADQLNNQGMIDGSFPEYTFSIEKRKIIKLTDVEIAKRLNEVLQLLSENGCLSVLVAAIRDDCDFEVAKTAAGIAKKFLQILKTYNMLYDESTATRQDRSLSTDTDESTLSFSIEDISDCIDDFINASERDSCSDISRNKSKIMNITSNEFINFVQQDLDLIVNKKKCYNKDIVKMDVLLDDMLTTINSSDIIEIL